MEGTDKATLKGVSCRFPATRLLRAHYSSLVHDRASQPISARSLEKVLVETETDVNEILSVPPIPPIEVQNPTPSLEQASLPWPTKLKVLRDKLSMEIESLQTSLYLQQQQLQMALPAVRALLQAASQSTAHTAAILNKASSTGTHLEGYRTRGGIDCGQRGCKGQALPFSRFCLNHISYDTEQVLYRKCSAVTTELLIQCNQAVLDILSEEPLCTHHYKGMSSDKSHGKKRTPGKSKPKASPNTRAKKGGSKHGGRSGAKVKQPTPQQLNKVVLPAAIQAPPTSLLTAAQGSPKHVGVTSSHQLGLGTQPTAVTPTRRRSVDGLWGDDLGLQPKQPRIGSLSEEQGITNSFSRTDSPTVGSPLTLTPAPAFPPSLSPLHFLPPGPVLGNIMSGESSGNSSDGDL